MMTDRQDDDELDPTTDQQDNPDPDDDEDDQDGADKLGDPGKAALEREKARRKAARDRVRELEAQLAELTKPKDGQTDPEAIRKAARDEARAETLRERVLDKIESRAARLFADPEDAVALLGRRVDEFIDDGSIDTDMIGEALADLLKRKPHLGAAKAEEKRFTGSADGGARKGNKPTQLTRDDLKKMTPEQIVAAKSEGRLNALMGAE